MSIIYLSMYLSSIHLPIYGASFSRSPVLIQYRRRTK